MKILKIFGVVTFVVVNFLFVSSKKGDSVFNLAGLEALACDTVECDGTQETVCADNQVFWGDTYICQIPSHNPCIKAC